MFNVFSLNKDTRMKLLSGGFNKHKLSDQTNASNRQRENICSPEKNPNSNLTVSVSICNRVFTDTKQIHDLIL